MKPVNVRRPKFGVLVVALLALFVGTAFVDYTADYLPPLLLYLVSTGLLAVALISAVFNVSSQRSGAAVWATL